MYNENFIFQGLYIKVKDVNFPVQEFHYLIKVNKVKTHTTTSDYHIFG